MALNKNMCADMMRSFTMTLAPRNKKLVTAAAILVVTVMTMTAIWLLRDPQSRVGARTFEGKVSKSGLIKWRATIAILVSRRCVILVPIQ